MQLVTTNGKEIWVRAIGITEFSNGKCIRFYGSVQNVDKQKKALEELAAINESIKRSLAERNAFLANVNHEIRTPLNSIIGFTALLQGSPLIGEQQEYVAAMQTAGDNLLSVINDILDLSKLAPENNGLVSVPTAPTATTAADIPVEQPAHASTKILSVLLCEDNILNQRLVKYVLEKSGHALDIANNGLLAVEMIKEKAYDIILMDLQMPGINGFQTTQIIRDELKVNTPIIAMTANMIPGEIEKCMQYGMNEYIDKPFKKEDLYKKIFSFFKDEHMHEATVVAEPEERSANIDFDYLETFFNGNKGYEKEMIELFINEIPKEINQLREAIEARDHMQVKALSHKLASSMHMMGFDRFVAPIHQIENESTQSFLSEASVEHFKMIYIEINNYLPELRARIA